MGWNYIKKEIGDRIMHHFFVDHQQIQGDHITIIGADVRHIGKVLRIKELEEVLISDGTSFDYRCLVEEIGDEFVSLRIVSKEEGDRELDSHIVLFQGLPKGDKMEWIVQKAVELGVHEIVPVAMSRCVVKLDDKKRQSKQKRWSAISEEAAKQSKRNQVPVIKDVMSLEQALEYGKSLDHFLVPYEDAKGMGETKKQIAEIKKGQSVGIMIGPEGGYDELEIEACIRYNAFPITLGRRILRTETAGLTALSILMFQLED